MTFRLWRCLVLFVIIIIKITIITIIFIIAIIIIIISTFSVLRKKHRFAVRKKEDKVFRNGGWWFANSAMPESKRLFSTDVFPNLLEKNT